MPIKSIYFVVPYILQPYQAPMYVLMEEGCQQICLEYFVIEDDRGSMNNTFRWMGKDNGAGTSLLRH